MDDRIKSFADRKSACSSWLVTFTQLKCTVPAKYATGAKLQENASANI